MMKRSGKCPKCGSARIVRAQPLDRGDGDWRRALEVATEGKPDALLFKDRHSAELEACVCYECGFVEWYVKRPEDLHAPD